MYDIRGMDDPIELTINYKNKELVFPVRLLNYGNSYKLELTIDKTVVLFEPDEERNWRALISYEEVQQNKSLDKDLLELIALAIDKALQ